jgi:hypothetical protein
VSLLKPIKKEFRLFGLVFFIYAAWIVGSVLIIIYLFSREKIRNIRLNRFYKGLVVIPFYLIGIFEVREWI